MYNVPFDTMKPKITTNSKVGLDPNPFSNSPTDITPGNTFGDVDLLPVNSGPPSNESNTFNFSDIFNNIFGNSGGENRNNLNPAMIAAYLAQAYNHYRDSDRYQTTAESYADRLDPFASQRGQYQTMLHNLMTDPQGYVQNDPFYQGQMRLALGPAQSQMRAKGFGNSGNILSELTKLSGDVTSKYINELRDDLGTFSGAQFGPGAAAAILGQGLQGSIDSRNQALGDIGALLGNLWRTRGNNDAWKDPNNPNNPNVITPEGLTNALTANGGRWTTALIEAARNLFKTPNGGLDIEAMMNSGFSANDIIAVATNGEDTGVDYPTEPPDFPDLDDPNYPPVGPSPNEENPPTYDYDPPPGYDSWLDWYDSADDYGSYLY